MMHELAHRVAAVALAALVLAAVSLFAPSGIAHAQTGLPRVVMMVTYKIDPKFHDEFRAWIAEFRTLVEKQIDEGKLSQTDICAYKSWRVLGPDPAGLNNSFIFVFEPVIPIANYLLSHYVSQALDAEATQQMMGRFSVMTLGTGPSIVYASPLDLAVDAIDLGELCEF